MKTIADIMGDIKERKEKGDFNPTIKMTEDFAKLFRAQMNEESQRLFDVDLWKAKNDGGKLFVFGIEVIIDNSVIDFEVMK